MHSSSINEMRAVLDRHLRSRFKEPLRVLDVGSRSVNAGFRHTYRELMPPAWRYLGSDTDPGVNVDLVQVGPYRIQAAGGMYDVALSGQCLEHVERPWVLVSEIARMLRPGGWLILTAPWQWPVHRFPLDCWRILPDGMAMLLRDAGLQVVETYTRQNDCWGIGRKPEDRRG